MCDCDKRTLELQLVESNDWSFLSTPDNTETCCVCRGSGRGEDPHFPCLNCDGCGYIWKESPGMLGLYGGLLK